MQAVRHGIGARVVSIDADSGRVLHIALEIGKAYRVIAIENGQVLAEQRWIDGSRALVELRTDGGRRHLRWINQPTDHVNWAMYQWRRPEGALQGILALPQDGQTKPPLVVDLHLGSRSPLISEQTCNRARAWAKRGLAVFLPEFRSSGILGEMALDWSSSRTAAGDPEVQDVVLGIDGVVMDMLSDPRPPSIFGHGYGGHLLNRILQTDHEFCAAAILNPQSCPLPYDGAGGDYTPSQHALSGQTNSRLSGSSRVSRKNTDNSTPQGLMLINTSSTSSRAHPHPVRYVEAPRGSSTQRADVGNQPDMSVDPTIIDKCTEWFEAFSQNYSQEIERP